MPTRTLILMRHAAASYSGGTRDLDRSLAPEGVAEAAAAGHWLAGWPAPDLALVSIAARAQQTYQATGLRSPMVAARELYEAGPGDILTQVQRIPDAVHTLLAVGHAPGMPALAAALAGPDSDPAALDQVHAHFPTATLAVLEFDSSWDQLHRHAATLVAYHTARPSGAA